MSHKHVTKTNATSLGLLIAGVLLFPALTIAPTATFAQSPCGRSIMLNGYNTRPDRKNIDDLDRKNIDEACKQYEKEGKQVQELAQKRVKARQQWRALDYNLQQCIDRALKAEASSIERKIEDGELPVFENTIGYLNARQLNCQSQ